MTLDRTASLLSRRPHTSAKLVPSLFTSTQQHDTSSHQNPFKSSDHRFMWLAATRPMRGRGAGWLAVLIPLWACLLALLRPPGRPRLPDDLAFACCRQTRGDLPAHHRPRFDVTTRVQLQSMRDVHFKRAFIFCFGKERPPRVT